MALPGSLHGIQSLSKILTVCLGQVEHVTVTSRCNQSEGREREKVPHLENASKPPTSVQFIGQCTTSFVLSSINNFCHQNCYPHEDLSVPLPEASQSIKADCFAIVLFIHP